MRDVQKPEVSGKDDVRARWSALSTAARQSALDALRHTANAANVEADAHGLFAEASTRAKLPAQLTREEHSALARWHRARAAALQCAVELLLDAAPIHVEKP